MKRVLATLAIVVGAAVVGHLAGCGLFATADQVNDPTVDADLWACRVHEQADYGINHDAGGAWSIYDTCVRDAGLR